MNLLQLEKFCVLFSELFQKNKKFSYRDFLGTLAVVNYPAANNTGEGTRQQQLQNTNAINIENSSSRRDNSCRNISRNTNLVVLKLLDAETVKEFVVMISANVK